MFVRYVKKGMRNGPKSMSVIKTTFNNKVKDKFCFKFYRIVFFPVTLCCSLCKKGHEKWS